ncbi:LysR family transcriptional regulator [Diaphorobacter ruginosibacter]|uniref:LysR family transcriptional regulator n=1 Tax=Diaphorobacter ruginosibacter TaxID=1715720 RepID=A0A7G9RMK4_9BURK|nr:LysR family transcriptional regulator [Diaphorobacter ruginosibacter]QNN56829.1 LysR family transcriptional regulator [Diaphorobacter ruginosibacter]
MQAFDIEQLRTFVHVVDAGSVTAGAAQVFLSQSAASEQLRKLEDRAGQLLLVRSKSGVVPTPAGQLLLAHARRLLALSDEVWRDLHGTPLTGELRLGITDYFRPNELTQLLAKLSTQHPGVRLRVSMGKSRLVEAEHAAGQLDIAITMRVDGKKTARSHPLRTEPLRWMAAPGKLPARGAPLPLVTLNEGCTLRALAEKALVQRKLPFDVVHVASGVAGMQSALAAGLGFACLNESAACEGVDIVAARAARLPALGVASFQMLPGRRGEDRVLREVRDLLVDQLG